MITSPVRKTEPVLSPRRIGLAGVAALVGCAACCAVPLLAAAGLGGGAVASLSWVFRPGSELIVGGAVFVLAVGVMAGWRRLRGSGTTGCGATCKVDGSCCERRA